MSIIRICLQHSFVLLLLSCTDTKQESKQLSVAGEQHRPQIHFTPKKAWMNDPNGMVYLNGTYHLFYQYYPDSTVWGPMHWGHATSKDLIHWDHQPIALYPDSLGYIFSGSAAVDVANTSGFGKNGNTPLVAIFTQHDPKGEKQGKTDFQNQSIAYSLDEGKTWTKYTSNPVLKNPGIKDFRDPKVSWNDEAKKWIMTLATRDRVTFYSSPDLKNWSKESEFGSGIGAHGGVWECPDLFSLNYNGENIWILLVSINPGGPNGGSATQYFTGKFDGNAFTPFDTVTRWIDYGPDDYAGVTWSNTGDRKIFLGWMSNWQYAQLVPTVNWRSAMTVPRELHLEKGDGKFFLTSKPVAELNALSKSPVTLQNLDVRDYDLTSKTDKLNRAARLDIKGDKLQDFSLELSNTKGQKLVIGYDKLSNRYFIDRTASGKTSFEKGFAAKHFAPRLSKQENFDLTLVHDAASVELFADDGRTVMTEIFFPDEDYSNIRFRSPKSFVLTSLQFSRLNSSHPKAQ